ncbi:probable glycosyltransferase STELLO1 [Amborella trichopoda]|uniref:Uncharacterized protein n=1 Tax=Amborella trichopoda TaxID=13333 RepID=W1PRM9_AMBTC|nr:probable glycosyltransferase STELLO1 [Amborella trichopoda]ERN12657.1 hypothetical protein AMTR_s00025p00241980 [Amborella trichopoda]|eukprot:XP_006851076.1 probable glycosyltransferase STELLO1 [Amborella trichopoda]
MMVQDRSAPKPTKPRIRAPPSTTHEHSSLDTLWSCSMTPQKLIFLSVAIATALLLLFLRKTGDTAAFLCFQSASVHPKTTITVPSISFSLIPRIPDPTRYAPFKSERWIVVSVSSPPTDALRSLSLLKSWQLLAIATSEAPPDWSLKNTIFLSLDEQAQLGYRIHGHLPYNSYIRKNIGYLFAIQHGAKRIFDADDRAEVIGGDLGTHLDLELVGAEAKKDLLLQYSHEFSNRSVVNPYVHFGQRSVWPRGLPLENVGEVGHEPYYTEIYSGRQFIQQGISNGLPDVDSVFYFTRKSANEAFDIRFDDHAPRVALPQGLLAPVNSFNTLFQSQAFWGLLLPVSVSSMASDIIRGYWAQRILWEIGGFLVFYPPTVQRVDKYQAYPFSEEKDLHVNVGRLVKFLINWRSQKHSLFDKILELSYAMAEEGFWGSKEVEFTAAWLQDLVGVGYLQPRLMALELDRQRAVISHGDHREFVPLKLPSVHLAVEEAGAVNYEIGNLIRWRKNFGNVVLIMYCGGPVNRTLEWRMLYGRIFKTVVIFSEVSNAKLGVEYGQLWQAYKYLPKVFDRFSNAEGFLFVKDNTVINYWNLIQADKTKLWITDKVSQSWTKVPTHANSSAWYLKEGSVDVLKKVTSTLPVHSQINYKENMGDEHIAICNSEIFYIPRRFVSDFSDLVSLVGDMKLHHMFAVPMFFLAMDSPFNFDSTLSSMVYRADASANGGKIYSVEAPAVYPWNVLDESEFAKLIRAMALGDPLLLELF